MRFTSRLHFRLFLSHLTLAVVVMVGVGVYLFEQMQQAYLRSLEDSLEDYAVLAAQRLGPLLAQGRFDEAHGSLFQLGLRSDVHVLVTDQSGRVVGSTEPEEAQLRGRPSQAVGFRRALRGLASSAIDPLGDELVYVAIPISYMDPAADEPLVVGAIRVSYSVQDLEARITSFFTTITVGALAALAISLLGGFGLAYGLSRSARRLAQAAYTLAQGDLTARVRLTGRDELAEAGAAFDRMADQLQATRLERQALFNTLSRDIYSAVSGMWMALEVLRRDQGLDRPSQELLLGGLQAQGRRLRGLATDLVEAARLTRGTLVLHHTEVSLEDLVREVTGTLIADAAGRGVRLECTVGEDLPSLRADQQRLAEALVNLVENALSYTPPGGRVLVTAEQANGLCVMSVQEEGSQPFPADAAADALFGPLVQAGTPPSGSAGLRLSIAKAAVEAHGGRLEQARIAQGGVIYRISLPVGSTVAGTEAARVQTP